MNTSTAPSTIYLRCPRCTFPAATRAEFLAHVERRHFVNLQTSTMRHGVAQFDGRWYSICENAYSDSTCMFQTDWEAQQQDDRCLTHVMCVYPDAQPKHDGFDS